MKQVLNRRKGCGNSPGNHWQREQLRCRVGYEGSKVVTGGSVQMMTILCATCVHVCESVHVCVCACVCVHVCAQVCVRESV